MKYTVHYSRKTRLAEFDMLEIGLSQEFDDSMTPYEMGFVMVRDKVEAWIRDEVARFSTGEEKPSDKPAVKQPVTVDAVSRMIPMDLKKDLYFEDAGEYVLVKSRKYLGQEAFRKVAAIIVDQLGGEYISKGRDSHFRIPKGGKVHV